MSESIEERIARLLAEGLELFGEDRVEQAAIRWREVLSLLREKNYAGYISYEAPNPAHWSRPAREVAREGADATRAVLAAIEPSAARGG